MKKDKINIKIQAILGPIVKKIVVFNFLHSLVSSFITIVVLFLLSERWESSQKTVGIFGALEFVGILGASVSDRWE